MPAPVNVDEGDLSRIYFLQGLAVADGNEPVFCAVYNVCMAIHMAYPFISAKMIT